MRRKGEQDGNLNGILAALYYLSKEAEQLDRQDISAAIRSAITGIDAMGEGREEDLARNEAITSRSTCTVLEFFDCYLRASPMARASFLRSLSEGVGT